MSELVELMGCVDDSATIASETMALWTKRLSTASPGKRQKYVEQLLAMTTRIHAMHGPAAKALVEQLCQLIADIANSVRSRAKAPVDKEAINKLLGQVHSQPKSESTSDSATIQSLLGLRASLTKK